MVELILSIFFWTLAVSSTVYFLFSNILFFCAMNVVNTLIIRETFGIGLFKTSARIAIGVRSHCILASTAAYWQKLKPFFKNYWTKSQLMVRMRCRIMWRSSSELIKVTLCNFEIDINVFELETSTLPPLQAVSSVLRTSCNWPK